MPGILGQEGESLLDALLNFGGEPAIEAGEGLGGFEVQSGVQFLDEDFRRTVGKRSRWFWHRN
jgi:hypothetical protein